jgi:hypothetical protein
MRGVRRRDDNSRKKVHNVSGDSSAVRLVLDEGKGVGSVARDLAPRSQLPQ